MILVDIFVPSVNKTYDFQLNETVSIDTVIQEICVMIEQKECTGIVGNRDNLLLCNKHNRGVLEKDKTLAECGIITGQSLILV